MNKNNQYEKLFFHMKELQKVKEKQYKGEIKNDLNENDIYEVYEYILGEINEESFYLIGMLKNNKYFLYIIESIYTKGYGSGIISKDINYCNIIYDTFKTKEDFLWNKYVRYVYENK